MRRVHHEWPQFGGRHVEIEVPEKIQRTAPRERLRGPRILAQERFHSLRRHGCSRPGRHDLCGGRHRESDLSIAPAAPPAESRRGWLQGSRRWTVPETQSLLRNAATYDLIG